MIADHDPMKRVGFWKYADTRWCDLHPYQLGSIIRYRKDTRQVAQAWQEVIRRENKDGHQYTMPGSALYNVCQKYQLNLLTLPLNVTKEISTNG